MNTYDHIPIYYWYRAQGNPPTNMVRWWKGTKYVGYPDEVSEEILQRFNLTYKGVGDINFIEGVTT